MHHTKWWLCGAYRHVKDSLDGLKVQEQFSRCKIRY